MVKDFLAKVGGFGTDGRQGPNDQEAVLLEGVVLLEEDVAMRESLLKKRLTSSKVDCLAARREQGRAVGRLADSFGEC